MVYSEKAEGKFGKDMRTMFKNHRQGKTELTGDDIMNRRQLRRISRLWNYDETSGLDEKIERQVDPTFMFNKTLI